MRPSRIYFILSGRRAEPGLALRERDVLVELCVWRTMAVCLGDLRAVHTRESCSEVRLAHHRGECSAGQTMALPTLRVKPLQEHAAWFQGPTLSLYLVGSSSYSSCCPIVMFGVRESRRGSICGLPGLVQSFDDASTQNKLL